jgi:hypothetical protein
MVQFLTNFFDELPLFRASQNKKSSGSRISSSPKQQQLQITGQRGLKNRLQNWEFTQKADPLNSWV